MGIEGPAGKVVGKISAVPRNNADVNTAVVGGAKGIKKLLIEFGARGK